MKKIITLLFAVTILASLSITTVFAETVVNDNISIELTTDKSNYAKDETIIELLTVTNNNTIAITNVSLETLIPEGYQLSNDSESVEVIGKLEAGQTETITVTFVPIEETQSQEIIETAMTDVTDDTLLTGDASNIFAYFVMAVISTGGIIVIAKKKKSKQGLAGFLCLTIIGTLIPVSMMQVSATESTAVQKTIEVNEEILVDEETVQLEVQLSYDDFEVDVNQYTVTLDLDYDNAPEPTSVQVEVGDLLQDVMVERDGYTFIAWFTDSEHSEFFDIMNTTIENDMTLYASWVDFTNEEDTDGDGLLDSYEEYFQTDINSEDTDGDGIEDYIEAFIFKYDPLKIDTDDNGITDGDEDFDGDGVSNLEEKALNMDPTLSDTDEDGLDDGEEVDDYKTDATLSDTDGDGASDGEEIAVGTDPLVVNDSFDLEIYSEDDDTVTASVEINLSGSQVGTISVEKNTNEILFPETMPGYIGGAYDFNVSGTFDQATINFEFEPSLLDREDFDPIIYYFNEENQELEALETTIEGNVATAQTSHFSTYILVNRSEYEDSFTWVDIWDTESYESVEIVLVIDDSGSMSSNDSDEERLSVAQTLVNNLPEDSEIGIVKFTSSASVLTELTSDKELANSYLTTTYFKSSGNTYMYRAIQSALTLYDSEESNALRVMVVLSDGATSDSSLFSDVVTSANEKNVKIYTVGLGSFESKLESLASQTEGEFYEAANASNFSEIYNDIGEKIDIETDSDNDGISDYYEDNMVLFNGSKIVLDKNDSDTDDDGLLDGEEIEVAMNEYNGDNTQVRVKGIMLSNPTMEDSDEDGLLDGKAQYDDDDDDNKIAPKDTDPLVYNGIEGIWATQIEYATSNEIPTEYGGNYTIDTSYDGWFNGSWPSALTGLGSYVLCFRYDEDEIALHSSKDNWQKLFGYMDLYDAIFHIGTNDNMDQEKFEFEYDGADYVVWIWKGSYLNLGSGAEYGVYTKEDTQFLAWNIENVFWSVVDFELDMTLNLYNYYDEDNIENIFSWAPTEQQWWITGFNPEYMEPEHTIMTSIGSIDFSNHEELFDALKIKYDSGYETSVDYLIFDEDGHTLWLAWDKSVQ